MKIEMKDVETVILEEIKASDSTRDDIALTYAFCITSSEDINFGKINRAIVARWSTSAREYIKTKAWKLVEGEEE